MLWEPLLSPAFAQNRTVCFQTASPCRKEKEGFLSRLLVVTEASVLSVFQAMCRDRCMSAGGNAWRKDSFRIAG